MTFQAAAKEADLWEGEIQSTVVSGVPVMLIRYEGRILAYVDRCAHRGIRISTGRLSGYALSCPGHEWVYDVRSGKGINPRVASLRPLSIRVDGDLVLVDVDAAVGGGASHD